MVAGYVRQVTDFCVATVVVPRAADKYSLVAAAESAWNAAAFPDFW